MAADNAITEFRLARDRNGSLKACTAMPEWLPQAGIWHLVEGKTFSFSHDEFFPQCKPGECMRLVAVPICEAANHINWQEEFKRSIAKFNLGPAFEQADEHGNGD